MAGDPQNSTKNATLGVLLGAAVVVLGVFGYLYFQDQSEVVTIKVPGFKGTITQDGDGGVFSSEIGKDKDLKIDVE